MKHRIELYLIDPVTNPRYSATGFVGDQMVVGHDSPTEEAAVADVLARDESGRLLGAHVLGTLTIHRNYAT